MSFEKNLFFLIFILSITLPSIYATENDNSANWDNPTMINVSIIGNSEINLDSSNRLVRAYVDIINFDPSDGRYTMRVIQPLTDKVISEQEILIHEKSNGEAGVDVAYLIDDDAIKNNGTIVPGDYKMEVFSERGNSTASASFSIIKPSEYVYSTNENLESKELPNQQSEEISTTVDNKSDEKLSQNNSDLKTTKIPEWINNIFVLYSNGSITENELLSALKFLIEQGILEINQ
jgi:hypothetical protein